MSSLALQKPGPPSREAAEKKSRRLPELDALRGFMLVWMTLTHLPTHASVYSNQTLGFVSAAEGFIFLSGFLTGRIFSRRLIQKGFREVAHQLYARAGRLYLYHLALLGVAFTVVAKVAVHTNQPSLTGLLDFFLAHPIRGLLTSIFLIYRPPLLDILPMYIWFLAASPLLLLWAHRRGWPVILLCSAAVWVAAQFGFRQVFYQTAFQWLHLNVPFSALGAFDLFAWQFLWVSALAVGSGEFLSVASVRRLWPVAAVLALTFVVIRHTAAWDVMNAPHWEPFIDKWHLGPLRLLNFAILGILFTSFQDHIARYITLPPLVTMGRASLEVFCAHLLICFEALALVGDGTGLSLAPQIAIVVSSLVALYVVGRAFATPNAT